VASLPNDFFLREFASGSMSPAVAPYWLATISGRNPSRAFGFAVLVVLPDRTLVSVDILPRNEFSTGENFDALEALLNEVLGAQFTTNLATLLPSAAVRDRSPPSGPDSDPKKPSSPGSDKNPAPKTTRKQKSASPQTPSNPPPQRRSMTLSTGQFSVFEVLGNEESPPPEPPPAPAPGPRPRPNLSLSSSQNFQISPSEAPPPIQPAAPPPRKQLVLSTKESSVFSVSPSAAPPSSAPAAPAPAPANPPAVPAPGTPPAAPKFWIPTPHLSDFLNPSWRPDPIPDDQKETHENINAIIDQCFEAVKNEDYLYLRKILRTTKEAQLRQILSAKKDANYLHRQTLLHAACSSREGRYGMLILLLQAMKQEEINAEDEDQRTPLHWTARYGRVWACELLLTREASTEAVDKDRQTPLHLAASNGHADCVACLLEHKAKIEETDKNERTPLHLAAFNGHVANVVCLLAQGAQIEAKDEYGRTPLHWAAYNGHADCVACLLEHKAKTEATDKNEPTPLHWAAYNGQVDCVACLLAQGAQIEAKDEYGRTPLHLATTIQSWKKLPVAAAEVLLSWLRGHGKDGEAVLAILRNEEFLRGNLFKSWENELQTDTSGAKEAKALLTEYGVDVNRLLADPPAPTQ
jgi:ankyrin repeat protein